MKIFPSTLVIHGSQGDLNDLLSSLSHHQIQNNPDILEVTEYTINSIRSITKFLANKPFSHSSKVILIKDAEKLSLESQNALLKNLEEPGPENYFLLTTNRPFALLPTIISRCHQIRFQTASISNSPALIVPKSIEEKLFMSAELASDRLSTMTYLESQLTAFQSQLVDSPSMSSQAMIKRIIKAINLIKANVDPKTALDFLLLSSPSLS